MKKFVLGAAVIAAAAFLTPGSGLPTALGVASAAPLGPQVGIEADSNVVLAKKGGPGNFAPGGNGPGGGGIPPGPGNIKPGGGGGGGKGGGKGGGHHHHHGWGGIGAGIIIGAGYCTIKSEQCADLWGPYTYSYRRCMRRAGCY